MCPLIPKSNTWGGLGADVAHTEVCMLVLRTIADACQPGEEKQEGTAYRVSPKGRQNREVQGID